MKYFTLLLIVILLSCTSTEKKAEVPKPTPLSVAMADSEMERNPDPRLLDFREKPKWEYTNGLVCLAMYRVYEKTGNDHYLEYVKSYYDPMILEDGKIITYKMRDYNIDRINPGKVLLELVKLESVPKYQMAIDSLRQQMRNHPRTSEGGFWHKKRYPHQMWLDGLYMGSPFLTQYANMYDEPTLFDDVTNQVRLVNKNMWDEEAELFYHGWDESSEQKWADPTTGLSPHFWGRAMGWFSMALVDMLDYFPENHEGREEIRLALERVARGVARYQDEETGVWWQVLNLGGKEGNYLEASCSSMFTYSLLKAVKNDYLDEKYLEVATKGFDGIKQKFIRENEDGTISLTNVCGVAGLGGNPYRDGSYEYYIGEPIRDDDPKGVGPFIMAALLYEEL